MKYLCLICKQVKRKHIFTKVYKKVLPNGKKKRVPVCCGHKMVLLPKGYKDESNNTSKN